MRRLIATLALLLFAAPAPAQPTRVNVQSAGVLPTNAADVNDVALAKLIDGATGPLTLDFPAGRYLISRPLDPDRGGLTLRSRDGASLVMTGRPDPVVMLGFGKRPAGQALTPDFAFDLQGKLDGTAIFHAGQCWGFRTRNRSHLSAMTGPLTSGYETYRQLLIEYAYDSTDTGEHSAPIMGVDGVWTVVDGPQFMVRFVPTDADGKLLPLEDLRFAGPTVPGLHRITIQLDLDAHAMQAFVDGVQVKVVNAWKAPAGTRIKLAANQARPFGLGNCSPQASLNRTDWWGEANYDRAFCGFALYSSARYADDGSGKPQRRLDGQPITDRRRYVDDQAPDVIASIPFTDAPTSDRYADRWLTVMGNLNGSARTSSLFVMDREHNRIGLFPFAISGLTLESPGDAVAIGAALTLDFRDCSFKAGPVGRGIGSWNFGASYYNRVRHCSLQGGQAAAYLFYGMWDFDDVDIGVHGRNTFWAVNSSIAIRRVFMGDGGAPERIYLGVGCPRFLVDDNTVDIEGGGYPSVAVAEFKTSIAMGGYVEQVKIRDLNVGGVKSGIPLVKLGVLDGHPDWPARVDVSGVQFGARPDLMSAMVQVDGPKWFGTVDITDDTKGKPWIVPTFAGPCQVRAVGPLATPTPAIPAAPSP